MSENVEFLRLECRYPNMSKMGLGCVNVHDVITKTIEGIPCRANNENNHARELQSRQRMPLGFLFPENREYKQFNTLNSYTEASNRNAAG